MMETRACKRHNIRLKKHRNPMTGEIIWTCPKEKCKYKENEEGEKI